MCTLVWCLCYYAWDNEVSLDSMSLSLDSMSLTGTWLDWYLTESAELTVFTDVVYLTGSALAELKEKGRDLTDRDVSLSVAICCELLGVRRLVGICCATCCATAVVALLFV